MKKLRGYIFSRVFLGERAPQYVQNIVIRDYCSKKRFQYLLSASEYAMVNSTFVLKQIINELTSIDGIVAYSVFQMPEDDLQRRDFFKKILLLNKEIHFAAEDLFLHDNNTFDQIEEIWQVKKTIPSCILP